MPRHLVRGAVIALLALSLVGTLAVSPAAAAGPWQTFLKTFTCNDLIAGKDTVWIATGEAGLVRYLRSANRFESSTREPDGLASNTVTTIAFDRSQRLWAGTPGQGLSRLSPDRTSWDLINAFDGLPSDSITTLRADGDTMWIGTPRGIALWNGREIAGRVPDAGAVSPFGSDYVTGIVVSGDSLFVATLGGVAIARISQQLAIWTTANTGLLTTAVTGLATDGREIFAVAGLGTYRWDFTGHQWGLAGGNGATKRLRDDFGHMLSTSSTGTFEWVSDHWAQVGGGPVADGSDDGGAEVTVDPLNHAFAFASAQLWEQSFVTAWPLRTPPGPAGNDVQNILADGQRAYVCTFDRGVSRYDGAQWRNWPPVGSGTTQDTTFVNPVYAFSLERDRQGRKWVANWGSAIDRFNDSFSPPHFDHLVVPTTTDDPRYIYTNGWSTCVDSAGYVFIGGDTPSRGTVDPAGIAVYDTSGRLVATYKSTNTGLPDNQVRALAIQVDVSHADTVLWAGIANRGVVYASLLPGRVALPAFTAISATSTLNIFGIVAHGDSIWVLTTSSLLRLRASTRAVQSSLTLAAAPAPRGAVRPLAVARDGTVYVGSVDGMRVFAPGKAAVDYRTSNSPIADNEVRAISVDPVTGIVWIGTANGVNRFDPQYSAPAPPRPAALRLSVYPNPVTQTGIGFELRLVGNTTAYSGEIIDLNGRILRRFSADANGRVIWDGFRSDGEPARPGIYFVHAHGGGRDGTARVVVLR